MIECQQLDYVQGHKVLLQQIQLKLLPGQIHVVLGANGAGKSTLLKCLSKDIEPTQGRILWQGQDLKTIDFESLAQKRAVLAQQTSLNFSFTVREIIQLGLNVLPEQKRPGLAEIAEIFDLQALLNQSYLTLSGGEQQRTQLARVFAQLGVATADNLTNKWVLLDEWNNGLDLRHLLSVQQTLRRYVELGLGVLMVVHDLNLALKLADVCHLLKTGHVVASGSPTEVLTALNLQTVFGVKAQWLSYTESERAYQWIQVE